MITVEIPILLRQFVAGQDKIIINTTKSLSLLDVVKHLIHDHSGLRPYLIAVNEQLPNFIAFYVDNQDARYQQGHNTPVKPFTTVNIVLAMAGG